MSSATPSSHGSEESRRLVRRAQDGDTAALDALFRLSHARLLRLVRARMRAGLRRHDDSDDLVQSALREALHDFARFRYQGHGSFQRWLAAIVEHKLSHRVRDHRRAMRAPPGDVVELDAGSTVSAQVPPALDAQPSEAAAMAETTAEVRETLSQLEQDERDVIVWRQFDGLANLEVAHALGITPAAASKRYLRALERLQGLLEARGFWRAG
jgi:RNA polymerase sigma-70 factor (ECF subfamily)